MTDPELISRFVDHRDAAALDALIRRHHPWIRAMAERIVRERSQAEDVAQAVLILLSRKAASLRSEARLSTWLFSVTRYCALNQRRSEQRRREHEREAAAMRDTVLNTEPAWSEIAPLLDDAVHELRRRDRAAVLLRFYEHKTFREVGAALAISEDAARKRVGRALAALRSILARRGMQISGPAMLAHLNVELIPPAAPAAGAATAGAASAGAAALAQSAGSMLWWATVKSWTAAAAAILLLIGSASVLLQQPQPPAGAAAQAPPPAPASQPSIDSGRVINAQGDPVPNASVYFVTTDTQLQGTLLSETTTDQQGRFAVPPQALKSPRPGLLIRSEGYGLSVAGLGARRFTEVTLRPAAPFSARLLDPDGKPAANLKVYVEALVQQQMRIMEAGDLALIGIPPALQPLFTATSDADGVVEFTSIGESLDARLQTDDERYARLGHRARIRAQSVQVDPTAIDLSPGFSAEGSVVDAAAKPLAGLKLRVGGGKRDVGYAEVETDKQGKFHVERMPAGQYDVSIIEPSSVGMYLSSLGSFTIDAQPAPVQLIAQPAARLTGTVRRKPDGAPAVNTELGVSRAGAELPHHAWAGRDGRYAINVPEGRYTVYLMKPPVMSKPGEVPDVRRVSPAVEPVEVDLKLGETRSVDLLLPPDDVKSLAGRVMDPHGNGVEGAEVFGLSSTAFAHTDQIVITDATGAFTMRAESGWILYARKGKWSTLSAVKLGENPGNLEIRIHPNATSTLKVYVVDEQRKPISGASVTLTENTERFGLGIDTRASDADGIVRFDPLFPDMKYSVSAKKRGWGEEFSRTIRTAAGREAEVVIKLPRASGSVSGVVVDVNGKPLPFTEVSYSSNSSGNVDLRSDRDGRFRFDGLVEGDRIFVYTRGKDTVEHHVETTTGDQNVRVVHEPEPRAGE